ncbi:unnamed protein product, partial [marine sediment metagenome]
MTEKSYFWQGDDVGDAATYAPWSAEEFADVIRHLCQRRDAAAEVISGYANELAVTNPSGTTIRTKTGACVVYGTFYINDAKVDNNIVAPLG